MHDNAGGYECNETAPGNARYVTKKIEAMKGNDIWKENVYDIVLENYGPRRLQKWGSCGCEITK